MHTTKRRRPQLFSGSRVIVIMQCMYVHSSLLWIPTPAPLPATSRAAYHLFRHWVVISPQSSYLAVSQQRHGQDLTPGFSFCFSLTPTLQLNPSGGLIKHPKHPHVSFLNGYD